MSKSGLYAAACLLTAAAILWFGPEDWALPSAVVVLASYLTQDLAKWLRRMLTERWRWVAAIAIALALAGVIFAVAVSTRKGPQFLSAGMLSSWTLAWVFWGLALRKGSLGR